MYDIILEARNKGVDKKYLADVKEMMKKHHACEMHTNEFWLQLLSRGWINQEDPEWTNSFYNDIDNIDAHDMKETAQRYFNMDNFIRGVLKPE